MAELLQPELLYATTTDGPGYTWNVLGLDSAFVECNVLADAATLQAEIVFEASLDGIAPWLPITNGLEIASSDGALTYAAATGELVINNPPAGLTQVIMVRVDRPLKFLRLNYTYTSGGGTFTVRCNGYGFQVNPTP